MLINILYANRTKKPCLSYHQLGMKCNCSFRYPLYPRTQSLGDVKYNLANLAPNLVPLLQGWWLCNIFSSCTIDSDVAKWKGQKTLLQCRYLSLTCEQGILQNRQPSGWVGTQLWSYVHQHCVDIGEGNIEEDREGGKVSIESDLVPWDVWVGESEPAPTSAPYRMDGWWMERCTNDEKQISFWVDSMSHIQLWWLTMYYTFTCINLPSNKQDLPFDIVNTCIPYLLTYHTYPLT
jgi:hypothetical protein